MEESSSKEMYEDIHSLIKEITRETSTSIGLGLNFKFTPTEPSSSDSGGEAGSAGGGDEVADPSGGGEAASPNAPGGEAPGPGEGGEAPGPGEGGEAPVPGDGGQAEVSGAGQNISPGLGFSASAGVDITKSTTNMIKQLSEITTTKVRFRFIACSILNICTLFIIIHIFRLMSHLVAYIEQAGIQNCKNLNILIYIYIFTV